MCLTFVWGTLHTLWALDVRLWASVQPPPILEIGLFLHPSYVKEQIFGIPICYLYYVCIPVQNSPLYSTYPKTVVKTRHIIRYRSGIIMYHHLHFSDAMLMLLKWEFSKCVVVKPHMHTGPRIFHICEQHCLARRAGITWAGKFHQDYFNGNPLLLLLRRRRLYVPCPTRHRHTGQFPLPVHSGQKSSKNMSYLIISYPLLVSFIRCCLWVQIQIVPTYVDIHFEHCKKKSTS